MKVDVFLEEFINYYLKDATNKTGITYRVHADEYLLSGGELPRVYVQLAARVAVCCDRGISTDAPWELIRGGVIEDREESRCRACGLARIGWLTSMTRQIYGEAQEIRDKLDEMLVGFEAKVTLERLSLRDTKLRSLAADLKSAVYEMRQSVKAIKAGRGLCEHEAIAIAATNVATGSPDKPGIYVAGNQLINWAIDPGSWPNQDERIEVRVPLT